MYIAYNNGGKQIGLKQKLMSGLALYKMLYSGKKTSN